MYAPSYQLINKQLSYQEFDGLDDGVYILKSLDMNLQEGMIIMALPVRPE